MTQGEIRMEERISEDFGISANEKLRLRELFFKINKDILWKAVQQMCDSHEIPSEQRFFQYFEC